MTFFSWFFLRKCLFLSNFWLISTFRGHKNQCFVKKKRLESYRCLLFRNNLKVVFFYFSRNISFVYLIVVSMITFQSHFTCFKRYKSGSQIGKVRKQMTVAKLPLLYTYIYTHLPYHIYTHLPYHIYTHLPHHIYTHLPHHIYTHLPYHIYTHLPHHIYTHLPYHIYTHLPHHNDSIIVKTDAHRKTHKERKQEDFFNNIFTSHFICKVCVWESAGDRT